jgi:hypothetical protein
MSDVKTNEEKIAELKEFCPTGESFKYLGVTVTAVSHFTFDYSFENCQTRKIPKLYCRYVDAAARIREMYFEYFELKTLIKLNK